MEINNKFNAMAAYAAQSSQETAKKDTPAPAAAKTDTVNFSSVLNKQRNLENMKKEVKKAVDTGASPERIQALKDMIAKEAYNISAEIVASAIFSN